ncbi:MAG: DNA polymerase IV [Verrucomicrobia bacterium]|nr:DNA polymerase IV [Verrucomicrobiota bacterium]
MDRTILHVDMDAFFAAVEQHDHPELRGKPVIVGAPPDQRGVVCAASYEARKFGIHSAMPSRDAGRLCPQAVFLPVNGKRYRDVSRQIFTILERFTPYIEPLSIDEAFLDVSGAGRLFGDGPVVAQRIKDAIVAETGLTASVGVAGNKFLAKLASDLHKPDGLTVVPAAREGILAFLAPLPVTRIWGVGRVTAQMLEQGGIRCIGELQAVSEQTLASIVGKHAACHLRLLAYGEDGRDIETERVEKSISREHTFARDCSDGAVVARTLADLVEDVGRSLREAHVYAAVVHLKLRWQGFKTITRQRALPHACCDDITLRRTAEALLAAEPLKQPVRLVGFGVSKLSDRTEQQLSLLGDDNASDPRRERLSRTVDTIRQRHGRGSIRRASAEASENAGNGL